ncbi:MAG: hypothetical protein ACRCX8_07235 [Sarcina sp.]
MTVEVNVYTKCSKCGGQNIITEYEYNKSKYGYDYEPDDIMLENSTYVCTKCKKADFMDSFSCIDINVDGEKCIHCESENVKGIYYDDWSGQVRIRCNTCKKEYNVNA